MASLSWLKRTACLACVWSASIGICTSLTVLAAHAQDAADAGPAPTAEPAPSADPEVPAEPAPPPVVDVPAPEPVPEPVAAPAPVAVPEPAPVAAPAPKATPAPDQAAPVEVTVVGTRLSRTAGSVHVIRKKDLERFEYDDPTKALMAVPGVFSRGEDGFGLRPNISIRGADPDRSKKITLLEDGILFGPAPYSAPAAYYFPVLTRMEKVRVTKGPGTIVNGPQTVVGTIDFTTRAVPTKTTGSADVAAGQYGYGKAHVDVGSSNEQIGFLIEGVRLQSNGFKELPSGNDTGFIRNEWMVKGMYVVDPHARIKNELNLKLTYSDEVSNETYLGLTDQDFKKNPNQRYWASQLDRMENHRTSIVLSHVLTVSPKLNLTTTAYRHDYHRTWRKVNGFKDADIFNVLAFPNVPANRSYYDALNGVGMGDPHETIMIGPNQRTFVNQGIESRLRWDTETGPVSHRLEVGARYHFDSIDRRHSQNGFVADDGELLPDGNPTEVTAFNRAWTHAVALHALYAVTWAGLTLTPGIRTELIQSGLYDRLSSNTTHRFVAVVLPGAGAYYAITEELGVLAGVYEGFSPPPPGSSDSVKPEKAINYEGGARYTKGALRLEAIGFYNDYKNLTAVGTEEGISGGAADVQYDLGAVRIYGVEVGGEHELPAGPVKLPLQLAYTFTRSEFLHAAMSESPAIGNAKVGDEMPYLPRHQVRAVAGVEHQRAGGNLALTYVAATREVAGSAPVDQVQHAQAQLVFDASVKVKIWKTISAYGVMQNLFDSQYIVSRRPFGARPNAPRSFQIGMKGSF